MARVKQIARFRVNGDGAVERMPERAPSPACLRMKSVLHVEPTIAKSKGMKGMKGKKGKRDKRDKNDKKDKKDRKDDETETESSASDADEQ